MTTRIMLKIIVKLKFLPSRSGEWHWITFRLDRELIGVRVGIDEDGIKRPSKREREVSSTLKAFDDQHHRSDEVG